jgi:putative ubiquitin-RnfH superfamily antitoxin RatB of RatAB toxin-antitoxin module
MSKIEVELVFALPDRQVLRTLVVAADASVREVINDSNIQAEFVDIEIGNLSIGIWGREVAPDQMLKPGDRIEIYRPLELEPREARRQLALVGRTMSGTEHN